MVCLRNISVDTLHKGDTEDDDDDDDDDDNNNNNNNNNLPILKKQITQIHQEDIIATPKFSSNHNAPKTTTALFISYFINIKDCMYLHILMFYYISYYNNLLL